MNDKSYKKKYELQNKTVLKQFERIKLLESENEKLKLESKKKDELINSVSSLRDELFQGVNNIKNYEKEYKDLVEELRKMKKIINQTVYKGKWRLVKFLIK